MMKRTPVYLDYNATAPIRPAVVKAMQAAMDRPMNPSSVHSFGRQAKRLVDEARAKITASVGAEGYHVIFTGSGTEANNLALKGIKTGMVLASAIEHSSVLQAVPDAVQIPVDANGVSDLKALKKLLATKHKPLVTVMLANNETGAIQPIAEIAQLVHAAGGIFHCDAVQGLGKMPLDISLLNVDVLTLSAHKIGGPQGVGALLVKPGLVLESQIVGGGQELGFRAGTENVAGIVGFGVAVEAVAELQTKARYLAIMRDRMESEIRAIAPESVVAAEGTERLPNTSCITMPGVKNETQLIHFDLQNIALSAGAACSSGKIGVSHVLLAMGWDKQEAESAVRISLGAETLQGEVDRFVSAWKELYLRVGVSETQPLKEAI